MTDDPKRTDVDFGFARVSAEEKTRRVQAVFTSVASRYDLMNDLMSGGLHRLWKRFAIAALALPPHARVLDLACGTGDLTLRLARRQETARLVACDRNPAMLRLARAKLEDDGHLGVRPVCADAEALPFPDASFDAVIIGFGLRNVTHPEQALAEMHRVLAPSGRAVVLEFSRLRPRILTPLYDFYSFRVLPRLGAVVAGDAASYRYLAESIRRHPDQETLAAWMRASGFADVRYYDLHGGLVAVHRGIRP